MKKQVLQVAIAAALGLSGANAQAALVIEGGVSSALERTADVRSDDKKKTASDSRHDWQHGSRVVVKEFGSGHASGYKGFGESMSLSDSLSLIVPEGWTVKLDEKVDPGTEVDWRASGDTWVEGLVGVMKSSSYSARVFWDRRSVEVEGVPSQTPELETIKKAKAKSEKVEAEAEEVKAPKADKPSVEPSKMVAEKKELGSHPSVTATVKPLSMTYMLPEGEYLSDALRNYVVKKGWKGLRWNIDHDYRLDAPVPMVGDNLIDAVTNLVVTYQSQGGLQGVEPVFAKGNKIVVIKPMDLSSPMIRDE